MVNNINIVLIGQIDSTWSWEYDHVCTTASLYLNLENEMLYLSFSKTHTKSGLGAGKTTTFINNYNVGTFSKPKKGDINSFLSRHKLSSDNPFRRNSWYNKEGYKKSLSDIFENAKSDLRISRTLKLKKIKALVK